MNRKTKKQKEYHLTQVINVYANQKLHIIYCQGVVGLGGGVHRPPFFRGRDASPAILLKSIRNMSITVCNFILQYFSVLEKIAHLHIYIVFCIYYSLKAQKCKIK